MDICPKCREGEIVWLRMDVPGGGWWHCSACQSQFTKVAPGNYVELKD
ncbi:hypothetical protein [Amycolatopsis sp. WAC 01376]|nr:hypothetical protein [Amycolatopsis sp. WAC 01376]